MCLTRREEAKSKAKDLKRQAAARFLSTAAAAVLATMTDGEVADGEHAATVDSAVDDEAPTPKAHHPGMPSSESSATGASRFCTAESNGRKRTEIDAVVTSPKRPKVSSKLVLDMD